MVLILNRMLLFSSAGESGVDPAGGGLGLKFFCS